MRSISSLPFSDSDHLPSGTSSAISSLIFADSVEDEQGAPSGTSPGPDGANGNQDTSGNLSALEYFTYDQSHTLGTGTPVATERQNTATGGDLFSTQVLGFPATNFNGTQPAIRRRGSAKSSGPRPLSDAMISNHYYDGHELLTDFPEPSEPPPPRLPPRSPVLRHPTLPPLWAGSNTHRPAHGATQPLTMNTSVYESTDSLYETVDNFRPLARVDESHTVDFDPPPVVTDPECTVERHKLALPPTPGSAESVKAPVALMDDDPASDV